MARRSSKGMRAIWNARTPGTGRGRTTRSCRHGGHVVMMPRVDPATCYITISKAADAALASLGIARGQTFRERRRCVVDAAHRQGIEPLEDLQEVTFLAR